MPAETTPAPTRRRPVLRVLLAAGQARLLTYGPDGERRGAGLDVFVDEPRVPAALRGSERATLQAHRASATWETRTAMGEMVLAAIAQALAGERPAMSLTT